ncbi:MAG: NTP transferase domain-containing protein [Thioclava marina]|uniref:NTP transferase domain-containing protein n=1 Tax=Thioclava marina TaxID=1915077 RepID=UPI00199337B2|nr:NTP transferase domain-containing protein [Thioclava marina]MBC7145981.1 NTP transferase domain-containing protein [Thioclava marina]
MRTLGILLAAGASRRFGAQDKLLADWEGAPLVVAAARALEAAGCDALLALVSSDAVEAVLPAPFRAIRAAPGLPLSHTWRAARDHAQQLQAERALFMLGDMPSVSAGTIRTLMADDGGSRACVFDGIPMPPALLTADDMRGLRAEEGDQGARALLRSLPRNSLVPLMAEEALDIDTPKDLCRDRVPPVVRP